ncbi:MAG: hypothetical protein KIT13_05650 [Burkholderiales bacterium]|nr:hypothetical protein [Burkholderiales bacterium]MCW5603294.1 hypothetical protein [Burkholderiales bacterium]
MNSPTACVVPPTVEKIETFLRYTDRKAEEVLGVLLALTEAMTDPYSVDYSGNMPGGETLIMLNGSIIEELGFNYTRGARRDWTQKPSWNLAEEHAAGRIPKVSHGSGDSQRMVRPGGCRMSR